MPTDLLEECALLRAPVRRVLGFRERVPGLVGELRVDRHDPSRVADDRVDARAVPVRVLDFVRRRRQRVVQETLEEQLAETAAGLWRAKKVLQRADVLRELSDPLALLAQAAELPG